MFEILHRAQGPTLEAYGKSAAGVRIIRGPLGGGKTYESIHIALDLCAMQKATKEGVRKSRGIVIRNTYPDLMSTVLKDFRDVVPEELGSFTMGHPPELNLDFDLEDGTRVLANVIFLALDKPDDVRKIRGMNCTWAYCNELKELARANFDMITARIDRYPMIGYSPTACIFADTNAWDKDHWLEDIAEQVRKGTMTGYEIFVQPGGVVKEGGKWIVNPLAENPPTVTAGYYQRVMQGKREDWIRVNLANEIGYSFAGKPVHPEFSSRNVAQQDLPASPGIAYWGIDFGLTPAAVLWQRQTNGQWFGLDEIVETDMANDVFAAKLKARCADWKNRCSGLTFQFIGDPSGDNRSMTDGRTTFQMYRLAGIPARPASSNDPQVRRNALNRPLTRTVDGGQAGLLLSPRMSMTIKALSGAWCYQRVQIGGTERYKDEAAKNEFSHVGEAAEYGLMDAGENSMVNGGSDNFRGQTSAISPTKKVWTPFDI